MIAHGSLEGDQTSSYALSLAAPSLQMEMAISKIGTATAAKALGKGGFAHWVMAPGGSGDHLERKQWSVPFADCLSCLEVVATESEPFLLAHSSLAWEERQGSARREIAKSTARLWSQVVVASVAEAAKMEVTAGGLAASVGEAPVATAAEWVAPYCD